jgi:6-phosphogluconolactonase (cycloisomerase 2 family)
MVMRRIPLVLLVAALSIVFVANAGARTRSLFVVNQLYSPPTPPDSLYGISTFSLDLDSGVLTEQPGLTSTGTTPTMPGITPDGTRFYTADWASGNVYGFSISSGSLTALTGSPWSAGTQPNGLAIDPSGDALWTANYGGSDLSGLSIDGAGALSAVSGSPFSTVDTPNSLAVSPRTPFVYVAGATGGGVDGFSRSATGELTHLSGFPLADSNYPMDVEFTVDGSFLFVADYSSQEIASYSIDQDSGALTLVGTPVATDGGATGLSATADGKWLIVSLGDAQKAGSYEINGDGTLSHVGDVPVSTAGGWAYPNDAITTPDVRFAYIANYWAGWIDGFSIAADGQLTTIPGSPWGSQPGPPASLAIVPNQGPIASFTDSTSGQSASFDASASSDPDGSVAQYAWDFGDGDTGSGVSPQHTYAAPGTYTVKLRVTDDENCSDEQIGTGQTLYCNGSSAATAQRTVTFAAPSPPAPAPTDVLTLTKASGKQVKSRRRGHKITRRVRARFTLSAGANVTYRFQKSRQGGTCRRRARTSVRHRISFRTFGKSMTRRQGSGKLQRTFANRVGGRRITPGRYRVRMQARDSKGRKSKLVITHSFCVR